MATYQGPSTNSATFADTARSMGCQFYATSQVWLTHLTFYRTSTAVQVPTTGRLYTAAGVAVSGTDVSFGSITTQTGVLTAALTTPVALTTNTRYETAVQVGTTTGTKTLPGQSNFWATGGGSAGETYGPLVFPSKAAATSGLQSAYRIGTTLGFPNVASGTGANYFCGVIVTDVNPTAPVEPTWSPAMTGGTVTWSADMTQADSVAAGYTDDSFQRQTTSGAMGVVDDALVPFPLPTAPAPFGRPGRALRVRIPDGYRRNEVVPDTPALVDGNSVFIGFSFLLEADVDTVATAGSYYQSIWQLRPDDSTGSPPVALEVIEEAIELTGGYGRPNPAGGTFTTEQQYRVRIYESPPKGKWINVVMFLGVWSSLNSGRVDVWIDGVQVVTNYRPKPGTNFGTVAGTSYPKNGVYHDGGNRGATVWFADHKHGTSYAAVDPTKTIASYGDVVAEP